MQLWHAPSDPSAGHVAGITWSAPFLNVRGLLQQSATECSCCGDPWTFKNYVGHAILTAWLALGWEGVGWGWRGEARMQQEQVGTTADMHSAPPIQMNVGLGQGEGAMWKWSRWLLFFIFRRPSTEKDCFHAYAQNSLLFNE